MRYPSPSMRGQLTDLSLRNLIENMLLGIGVLAITALVVWGFIYAITAPRSGTVEATWLEPAHMETYRSGSICYSYDKSGYCSFSMPIYSDRWVPDQCYIQLNDKEKTKREATWNIPCYEKDSYKIGSWVNLE